MLNEVVYCPRLFYLEHVGGEWEESADTVSGKRVHRRVDAKASPLPEPGDLPEDLDVTSEGTYETTGDTSLGWGFWSLTVVPKAGGEPIPMKGRATVV